VRGSYVHNHTLLDPVIRSFRDRGALIRREYGFSRRSGYVDCLIDDTGSRIVVEAELSPRRIHKDVAKALALGADWLLIICPTGRIARACRSALQNVRVPESPTICFLTLGTYREWFTCYSAFVVSANVGATFSLKIQPTPINTICRIR
jgi:hypothetical protein